MEPTTFPFHPLRRNCLMSNSKLIVPGKIIQLKAILVIMLLSVCFPGTAQRRCSGTSNCGACTTCNYCKNCNKYGGSCGVCGGGKEVQTYKAPPAKTEPVVDNSYSPANEHAYESTATDTVAPAYYEPGNTDYKNEEESGGGTTLLLSLIAIILFFRWVNKQSK